MSFLEFSQRQARREELVKRVHCPHLRSVIWAADDAGCVVEAVSAEDRRRLSPLLKSPLVRINQHYFLFHLVQHVKLGGRGRRKYQETTLHIVHGTVSLVCGHIHYVVVPGYDPAPVIVPSDDLSPLIRNKGHQTTTIHIPLPIQSSDFGKYVGNWGVVPDLPPATPTTH